MIRCVKTVVNFLYFSQRLQPLRYSPLWRIPAIQTLRMNMHRLLVKILKRSSGPVRLMDGRRMYVDPLDSLNLSVFGVYEPFETEVMAKLVKPGWTVVDIGANVGYYTLLLANLVGKSGRVVAFEPDPDNYSILCRNMKLNSFENVETVRKAVTSSAGSKLLHLNPTNRGGSSLRAGFSTDGAVAVDCLRLDDYFDDGSSSVDFVKIDVEGAEGTVLDGARKLIDAHRDIIVMMEYRPEKLELFNTSPLRLLREMARKSFRIYNLDSSGCRIVEVTDLDEFSDSRMNTNIVLARDEIDWSGILDSRVRQDAVFPVNQCESTQRALASKPANGNPIESHQE